MSLQRAAGAVDVRRPAEPHSGTAQPDPLAAPDEPEHHGSGERKEEKGGNGLARRSSYGASPNYPCGRFRNRPEIGHRCPAIRCTSQLRTVPPILDPTIAARLRRDPAGLVPAIVQECGSGDVLMLAWMNDEALHRTLTTGRATYWSRSRATFWVKGETSGHHQYVKSVKLDCDGDTLLVTVEQVGAACHTGAHTCFQTELTTEPA
jgi:phosphoribosyl-AMP cyclohydrolase